MGIAAQDTLARLPDPEAKQAFARKETLLLRPLGMLLEDAHGLAGFIGLHGARYWKIEGDKVSFTDNPLRLLHDLYHYLDLDYVSGEPPSEMIWDHDQELLASALAFYDTIEERTGVRGWEPLQKLFESDSNEEIDGGDANLWNACLAAHRGFQLGMELLLLIPRIAASASGRRKPMPLQCGTW